MSRARSVREHALLNPFFHTKTLILVSYAYNILREGGVADWRVCIRNAGLTRARRAHQETLVAHEIGEPLYATMTPVVLRCDSYDAARH